MLSLLLSSCTPEKMLVTIWCLSFLLFLCGLI